MIKKKYLNVFCLYLFYMKSPDTHFIFEISNTVYWSCVLHFLSCMVLWVDEGKQVLNNLLPSAFLIIWLMKRFQDISIFNVLNSSVSTANISNWAFSSSVHDELLHDARAHMTSLCMAVLHDFPCMTFQKYLHDFLCMTPCYYSIHSALTKARST